MSHDPTHPNHEPTRFWASRFALGLVVIGGVAAYFVFSEHRAHLAGALPFVLLLACPLMHLFMHHGQRSHGRPPAHEADGTAKQARPPDLQADRPGERP
jgi:Protein of unknown function (DUF2933)